MPFEAIWNLDLVPKHPKKNDESTSLCGRHFDGARSKYGARVSVAFTSPSDNIFPFPFCLEFDCTNNMTEYKNLLLGAKNGHKIVEGMGGF
jgi:hypothetical protein